MCFCPQEHIDQAGLFLCSAWITISRLQHSNVTPSDPCALLSLADCKWLQGELVQNFPSQNLPVYFTWAQSLRISHGITPWARQLTTGTAAKSSARVDGEVGKLKVEDGSISFPWPWTCTHNTSINPSCGALSADTCVFLKAGILNAWEFSC